MIPKVIHYIWLGGNPEPNILKKCKRSWRKYCPDYEIKRWDETNLDLNKFKFAKDAYNAKKWAFASDVFRFDILYKEGGIYLDTDVELIKPIDEFLAYEFFTGFESEQFVNPGLIMGCKKESKIANDILEIYKKAEFNIDKLFDITVCKLVTSYLVENYNLKQTGETQRLKNNKVVIFSPEYFCPKSIETLETIITKNTVSIHHYSATWVNKTLKDRLKALLRFCIGNKNYQKIRNQYRKNKGKKP